MGRSERVDIMKENIILQKYGEYGWLKFVNGKFIKDDNKPIIKDKPVRMEAKYIDSKLVWVKV